MFPLVRLRVGLGAFALLTCCLAGVRAMGDVAGEQDSFPGWRGATATADARRAPVQRRGIDTDRVVQLSAWKPRAYLYKGFLSAQECDHLIGKASPKLARSGVADNGNGHVKVSEVRTSSGMFVGKGEDEVVKAIERRVSEWTFLPIANQESLQILRYTQGQKYEPHFDFFRDSVNTQRGGHRYATVLMYLNDVEQGGETVFPAATDDTLRDSTWSDCTRGKLAVKPRKGDAVLFFSMHPDGTPDESSLHHACPVLRGEKWSAPMWIRVSDFNRPYQGPATVAATTAAGSSVVDAKGCSDAIGLCKTWADRGECQKNPVYMLRACKKSCNSC